MVEKREVYKQMLTEILRHLKVILGDNFTKGVVVSTCKPVLQANKSVLTNKDLPEILIKYLRK